MQRVHIVRFGIVALLLALGGCSPSAVRLGNQEIGRGNYEKAEVYFERALQDDPQDFKARRGLARVYYYMKDYPEAARQLEKLRLDYPDDGVTVLYLGLTREAQDDFAGAEAVYNGFLARGEKSKTARRIRGRMLYVRNEKARQQVRQALEFEKPLFTDTSGATVVGILPFVPTGEEGESLQPVAAGLAALVSSDLQQVGGIRIVERTQLRYILEEIALAEQGITAEQSAPRAGRLLGASHLVNGSLSFSDADHVAVQSGIVNTVDSFYRLALDAEENYAKIWQLQKQITFAVIDSLGLELTPAEQNALQKIPTENFDAFLAYCRGLEQLDQGNFEKANEYFDQAAALDPGFEQASSMQEETELLAEGDGTIDEFEASIAGTIGLEPDFGTEPAEDIFEITAPEADPRTDDEPAVETGTASVKGTIR